MRAFTRSHNGGSDDLDLDLSIQGCRVCILLENTSTCAVKPSGQGLLSHLNHSRPVVVFFAVLRVSLSIFKVEFLTRLMDLVSKISPMNELSRKGH